MDSRGMLMCSVIVLLMTLCMWLGMVWFYRTCQMREGAPTRGVSVAVETRLSGARPVS